MNRAEFMRQLESLLQNVSPTEREEAIQYYNDYFDDAGKENEKEVIEALGNPARVAENIRRDLLGSGYGESAPGKAQASDRALMEYGKRNQGGPQETEREQESESVQSGTYADWSQSVPEERKKEGMPVWLIAFLVTVLIFASPVLGGILIGILGTALGLVTGWFAMILGCGMAAVCLILAFVVLVVLGIIGLFANPWAGMVLVGGGLICGCIGILFVMLTVLMAGIATPAAFRGIAALWQFIKGKRRKAAV